jgi:hypothetical protein
MRRLRRGAGLVGILLATACGSPDAGTDTTLSAAGAAGAEPAPTVTSSSSSTTLPATTVAPSTTVPRAAPATTATTTARRTGAPAAPAPTTIPAATVPTIPVDTVVAVTTTRTEGSTVANVRAVREQYLGEKVYVWVEATSAERITSIRIDFGDGYVTTDPQTLPSSLLTATSMSCGATRAHVYPAAGRYRITVTLTVVPGLAAPVLTGPPTELQWLPTGPEHAVTITADLRQRPDAAPPGYPRLPPMMSE